MPGPDAKVRYTAFSTPERSEGLQSRSLKSKVVSGQSGYMYNFRQQGRPTNPNSQWLPVHVVDDMGMFEERDGFEVRRNP